MGSPAVIRCKYPKDSLLCANQCYSVGEQLRKERLKAGYTIEQVANAVGVGRRCVMNYENGVVRRMKQNVIDGMKEYVRLGGFDQD